MKRIIIALIILLPFLAWSQVNNPDASIWENTWTSCQKSDNPIPENGRTHWIMYDFGVPRNLSKTWIWNTNEPGQLDKGMKTIKVDYSMDGNEWTNWGQMSLPKAKGEAVYSGFPGPDMVGLQAQYVLITGLENHGHATCFGLAEVKFNLLPDTSNSGGNSGEVVCESIKEFFVLAYVEEAFIEWEYVEGAEYRFYYRMEGERAWIEYEDLDEPEMFLEDLKPETNYEFYVDILCEGEWLPSEIQSFRTLADGDCTEFEEVRADGITDHSARLYWDIEIDDVNFTIVVYSEEDMREFEFETRDKTIVVDDLLRDTEYFAEVYYECQGVLWFSEEISFRTSRLSTSVNDEGAGHIAMRVFPNPSDGRFTLGFTARKKDIYNLVMMDVGGGVVYRNVVNVNEAERLIPVDLGELPEGTYIMRVLSINTRKVHNEKIIITE